MVFTCTHQAERRSEAPPPGAAMQASLLLVLHVTPIGGVLTDKEGLEGRSNLLPKDGTLLIGLHGLERVPYADGKAAVGIIDILGQPPTPQACDRFPRHGRLISLLIGCPAARP